MKRIKAIGLWAPNDQMVFNHTITQEDQQGTLEALMQGTLAQMPPVLDTRLSQKFQSQQQQQEVSRKLTYGYLGAVDTTEAGKIFCFQTYSGLRFVVFTNNDRIEENQMKTLLQLMVQQYVRWKCNPFSNDSLEALKERLVHVCSEKDEALKWVPPPHQRAPA